MQTLPLQLQPQLLLVPRTVRLMMAGVSSRNYVLLVACLRFLLRWGACASIDDYCSVNPDNTPCATNCTRAACCGETDDRWRPLTSAERQIVLDKHNALREGVAAGVYAAHQLPPTVGGIRAMSYSLELEFLAACWINQCWFEHDHVRLNARGEKVGQNLHQTYYSAPVGWPEDFIADGIQEWFDEWLLLTDADADLVRSFAPRRGIGHLTAMIWGETAAVGCAIMHFRQQRRGQPECIDHAYNLYCNYAPRGNWVKASVYADRECAEFSADWPHLCGEVRPLEGDDFVAPSVGGAPDE